MPLEPDEPVELLELLLVVVVEELLLEVEVEVDEPLVPVDELALDVPLEVLDAEELVVVPLAALVLELLELELPAVFPLQAAKPTSARATITIRMNPLVSSHISPLRTSHEPRATSHDRAHQLWTQLGGKSENYVFARANRP